MDKRIQGLKIDGFKETLSGLLGPEIHCEQCVPDKRGLVVLCPLHAAAPALLEALERVMADLQTIIDHVDLERTTVSGEVTLDVSYAAMEQARAAIARAKGQ